MFSFFVPTLAYARPLISFSLLTLFLSDLPFSFFPRDFPSCLSSPLSLYLWFSSYDSFVSSVYLSVLAPRWFSFSVGWGGFPPRAPLLPSASRVRGNNFQSFFSLHLPSSPASKWGKIWRYNPYLFNLTSRLPLSYLCLILFQCAPVL